VPYNTLPATPLPDLPIGDEPEYAVSETKFGDGYSQFAEDGINAKTSNVTLTWTNLNAAEFETIRAFLDAHAPATPFLYTAPGAQAERKFICPQWGHNQTSVAHYSIRAKLTQYHGA